MVIIYQASYQFKIFKIAATDLKGYCTGVKVSNYCYCQQNHKNVILSFDIDLTEVLRPKCNLNFVQGFKINGRLYRHLMYNSIPSSPFQTQFVSLQHKIQKEVVNRLPVFKLTSKEVGWPLGNAYRHHTLCQKKVENSYGL